MLKGYTTPMFGREEERGLKIIILFV